MATIKRFEEIISWKEARVLNSITGKLIDDNRFKNNFRLINQIDGSAGSIMDNIVEGYERGGNKEFVQFLYISKGSCGELRSQLYRALDRNYITTTEFDMIYAQAMKVGGLLQRFINYLEDSSFKGNKYKNREKKVPKVPNVSEVSGVQKSRDDQ